MTEPVSVENSSVEEDHSNVELTPDEAAAIKEALGKFLSELFSTRDSLNADAYMRSVMSDNFGVPLDALVHAPEVQAITQNVSPGLVKAAVYASRNCFLDKDMAVRAWTRPEADTLILRDVTTSTAVDDILAIFDTSPEMGECPKPLSARPDMNDTWFVVFSSAADAKEACGALVSQKGRVLDGKRVSARIKTTSSKPIYTSPTATGPPAMGSPPGQYNGAFWPGGGSPTARVDNGNVMPFFGDGYPYGPMTGPPGPGGIGFMPMYGGMPGMQMPPYGMLGPMMGGQGMPQYPMGSSHGGRGHTKGGRGRGRGGGRGWTQQPQYPQMGADGAQGQPYAQQQRSQGTRNFSGRGNAHGATPGSPAGRGRGRGGNPENSNNRPTNHVRSEQPEQQSQSREEKPQKPAQIRTNGGSSTQSSKGTPSPQNDAGAGQTQRRTKAPTSRKNRENSEDTTDSSANPAASQQRSNGGSGANNTSQRTTGTTGGKSDGARAGNGKKKNSNNAASTTESQQSKPVEFNMERDFPTTLPVPVPVSAAVNQVEGGRSAAGNTDTTSDGPSAWAAVARRANVAPVVSATSSTPSSVVTSSSEAGSQAGGSAVAIEGNKHANKASNLNSNTKKAPSAEATVATKVAADSVTAAPVGSSMSITFGSFDAPVPPDNSTITLPRSMTPPSATVSMSSTGTQTNGKKATIITVTPTVTTAVTGTNTDKLNSSDGDAGSQKGSASVASSGASTSRNSGGEKATSQSNGNGAHGSQGNKGSTTSKSAVTTNSGVTDPTSTDGAWGAKRSFADVMRTK